MNDMLIMGFTGLLTYLVGVFLIDNLFFKKPRYRRTVIDKYITWDQYGNPHYWIIVKDTEGNLEQLSVNDKKYYSYETDMEEPWG